MLEQDLNQDILILNRLKNSDESALTELYTNFWQPLFMASYNVLKDKELSEDVIQDVFMNIWHNREKLEIHTSLKSYLYACARYQVFNQIKKNKDKIRVALFEDLNTRFQNTTPETQLMHDELVQHINMVVNNLPEKCQLVYKLSREEQLSHKEIAERLGISAKTVENHVTKALHAIRLSMGTSTSVAMVFWLSKNLFK
ncbi:RNA polymerase sigma-70 factor [Flavobacterium quisquiliarum]|uniref:RNA polymerase sigma-70 factor n=1 Tax=Flavobacterium quisquiliarum TaxID=1834436 RepID=A0ABV8W818_9FLAO|nr:RNA polymerase sigma-70 factor [Flavobacterium quisquiliarum]MBW1655253.1 RNA polymerase sigma-70 factor [Flavobacterium quisquiliarum]NWL00639.1 RNA polymerase sigma-70 factor [Flavobacterium collinsii]